MKKRLLVVLLLIMMAPAVWGQGCAICTKTAAGLGDKSVKGLNSGILYLAFLPLGIIGSLGFIWWKYNKNTQ